MAAKTHSVPKWMDPVLKGKKKPKSKKKSTLQKQMDEVFKADKVLPNRDEREPAQEERNPVPILDTEAPPILESESPILSRKTDETSEVCEQSKLADKISKMFASADLHPSFSNPKEDVPLKEQIESLFTLSKQTSEEPERRPVPALLRPPDDNGAYAVYRNVRESLKKLVSLCLSKDEIDGVVRYVEWLKHINDEWETSKPIITSPKPWPTTKRRQRPTVMPSDNALIVQGPDGLLDGDDSLSPPQST